MGAGPRGGAEGRAGQGKCCRLVSRSRGVNLDLDVKASLVAVLFAVVDVVPEHFALDAQFGVHGQVGELQRHQGLQVVRVQQLAVVRVVLHGEAAADAVVLDIPDFAGVLLFLLGGGGTRVESEDRAGERGRAWRARLYLVGAVEREDVGLDLILSLVGNAVVRGGRLGEGRRVSLFGAANRTHAPQSLNGDRAYLWTEVDDPVELHDHARLAFLEAELAVFQAGAGSEQTPGESAGLPDPDVTLQVAAVLILSGLI